MKVDWVPSYRTATISVNHELGEDYREPEMLERIVVHELCHLVLAPMTDYIEQELNENGQFFTQFNRNEELMAEKLAKMFMEMDVSTT